MPTIRPESPADLEAIRRVHCEAFGDREEADLVEALRSAGAALLSLVAEVKGEVVGHILFSPATVVGESASSPIVGLAPMAVLPRHQGRGIGSMLVESGLEMLREEGHNGVAVLGHPEFYPRFGFLPSIRYGITCEYRVEPQYFMMLELAPNALERVKGVVHYHPAFAGL